MRLTIGGVIVNILRIVLTVIFVIDCIGLTVVVLMRKENRKVWVLFQVWRILTGDRIKVVPWKVIWFWQQRSWRFCLWYWQSYWIWNFKWREKNTLATFLQGCFLHTERSDQQWLHLQWETVCNCKDSEQLQMLNEYGKQRHMLLIFQGERYENK